MSGLEGGCACRAVRRRLKSAPMFTNCRHCADRQRSAFVINAIIETDRIQVLSGEFAPTAMPTDWGRPHLVRRCTDEDQWSPEALARRAALNTR